MADLAQIRLEWLWVREEARGALWFWWARVLSEPEPRTTTEVSVAFHYTVDRSRAFLLIWFY